MVGDHAPVNGSLLQLQLKKQFNGSYVSEAFCEPFSSPEIEVKNNVLIII